MVDMRPNVGFAGKISFFGKSNQILGNALGDVLSIKVHQTLWRPIPTSFITWRFFQNSFVAGDRDNSGPRCPSDASPREVGWLPSRRPEFAGHTPRYP